MVQCGDTAQSPAFLNSSTCSNYQKLYREDIPLRIGETIVDEKRQAKLRRIAIASLIISIILTLVLCVISFIFASVRQSPAAFAFAADCLLDLISSLIVIWRYFDTSPGSHSKEVKACIVLGVLFILAGAGVIGQGVYFLCARFTPKWYDILIALAATGFAVCILLGVGKYMVGKKMDSKPLILDALNSLLSSFFALAIIVSDLVYLKNKNIWFLDPVFSIILSIGLLIFGIHTIIVHGAQRNDYERAGP